MNARADIFTAVKDLSELALEEADARLEAVILPHLDREEVMVILLGILVRGVLSEKRFSYLFKVAKKAERRRVEPIRCRTFQTGEKCDA